MAKSPDKSDMTDHALRAEVERLRRELAEARERNAALLRLLPQGFAMLDPAGVIVEASDAYHRLHGYEPGELVGQSVRALLAGDDGKARLDAYIATVLRDRPDPEPYVALSVRKSGEAFESHTDWDYVIAEGGELRGFNTIVTDISGRRRVEEALRESQATLQTVFSTVPAGIGLARDRVIEWVNEELTRMLGYRAEEIVGRNSRFLYETEAGYRRVADVNYPELEETGISISETRWLRKNGAVFDLELRIAAIDGRDRAAGIVFTAVDITERKRAAEALRENEARLRVMMEAAPGRIYVFDLNGRIQFVNRVSGDLRFEDVLDTSYQDWFLPEYVDAFGEAFERVIASRESEEFEAPIRTQAGGIRWLYGRLAPLERGGAVSSVIVLCHDVTDRKESVDALARSEALLSAVMESMPFSLCISDAEGRFVLHNPGCQERWNSAGKETLDELDVPGELRQAWKACFERALAGEPVTEEHSYTDGGEVFHSLDIFSPYRINGEIGGVVKLCIDITERRRAEEAQRAFESQMQQAQKLESLGVLAGGIAHDFNNLLMAILGNCDLALNTVSPVSPVRENLADIEQAAHRAADLCRQMLAYSGKGRFEVRVLDLNELVREMAHLLSISISKSAVMKYNFAHQLPAVQADPTQLRQVIMNLITNASEAIGERSGVISITTGAMHCDRAYLADTYLDEELAEGTYVYLEVADTGCGMTAEVRERIFDPFYTTKFSGRGLGMAAVLGIMRGHDGAIKVYSEPGRGTTFKALFPAVESAAERIDRADANGEQWRGEGVVLLVDDEESVRVVGQRMLERLGYGVLTAADGREALSVYQENREAVRCVVLDLTMPHMDGQETFRELRRIDSDVCVIMSSGYNEQEIRERFAGKSLSGFVQKPYRMHTLAEALREASGECE